MFHEIPDVPDKRLFPEHIVAFSRGLIGIFHGGYGHPDADPFLKFGKKLPVERAVRIGDGMQIASSVTGKGNVHALMRDRTDLFRKRLIVPVNKDIQMDRRVFQNFRSHGVDKIPVVVGRLVPKSLVPFCLQKLHAFRAFAPLALIVTADLVKILHSGIMPVLEGQRILDQLSPRSRIGKAGHGGGSQINISFSAEDSCRDPFPVDEPVIFRMFPRDQTEPCNFPDGFQNVFPLRGKKFPFIFQDCGDLAIQFGRIDRSPVDAYPHGIMAAALSVRHKAQFPDRSIGVVIARGILFRVLSRVVILQRKAVADIPQCACLADFRRGRSPVAGRQPHVPQAHRYFHGETVRNGKVLCPGDIRFRIRMKEQDPAVSAQQIIIAEGDPARIVGNDPESARTGIQKKSLILQRFRRVFDIRVHCQSGFVCQMIRHGKQAGPFPGGYGNGSACHRLDPCGKLRCRKRLDWTGVFRKMNVNQAFPVLYEVERGKQNGKE